MSETEDGIDLKQPAIIRGIADSIRRNGMTYAASIVDGAAAEIERQTERVKALESECERLRSGRAAVEEIAAERKRQIESEGWTAEHDDQNANGSMALAAAAYAMNSSYKGERIWPWSIAWWKPTERRRDLIKAGALIVAEIERLDRLAGTP